MAHIPPNSSVLKGIIDVQVPNSISWAPQTFGWKILFTVLMVLMLFLTYRAIKTYHKNRYRRQAIRDINMINSERPYQATSELFHLMKRVAVYLDKANASKSGNDLLQFFILTKTHYCVHFHTELTKRALQEIWLPEKECSLLPEQIDVLISQFKNWLAHHSLASYHVSINEAQRHV